MEGTINNDQLLRVLNRYLPILGAIPYSRAFPLVGSLAEGRARAESDIDLVVVAQKNRLWLNRALLVATVTLIGRRRTAKNRRGRFCFNASFAAGEGQMGLLSKFYPSSKNLAIGSRPILAVRDVLEFVLELSPLGAFLERLSQKLLISYIHRRFARFKNEPDAVLILKRNLIIYHPPRHFCG